MATRSRTTGSATFAGLSGETAFDVSTILGLPPKLIAPRGRGAALRCAIAPCPLGLMLVAVSDVGVCAIAFGDDRQTLREDLTSRFPKASITEDDAALTKTVDAVLHAIDQPSSTDRSQLPLDIRGTVFQHKVWRALQEVPQGATTTYAEIARRIGRPNASRAVAAACAANPIAVLIPCHRVLRSDGSLSGYRWGTDRKAQLLAAEQSAASGIRRAAGAKKPRHR